MILDFHTFVEGDITKIGLLLADLAPLPHNGDAPPTEMARALLQCYSGTDILLISEHPAMFEAFHTWARLGRQTHQRNRRPSSALSVQTGVPLSDRPPPAPPAGHLHAHP